VVIGIFRYCYTILIMSVCCQCTVGSPHYN
jgi:hypothetical protein